MNARSTGLITFFLLLGLGSCAPKVTTNIKVSSEPLDYREKVRVYTLVDAVPTDITELGTAKIGDTGFTVDCSYDKVIALAKLEARKAGGNAIKIVEHTPPDLMSSCHRITFLILRVHDFNSEPLVTEETVPYDSTATSATICIYRPAKFGGALVSYMIHVNDSAYVRAGLNAAEMLEITEEGPVEIWAQTEAKTVLPLTIQFGRTYYVRCGVSMGVLVGRPSLVLVDPATGEEEFTKIAAKKSEK